jgi:3-oxoacyl-[acyl-carrier-protein] synthase-1
MAMITPVGADTRMTAASVEAGINRVEESRYWGKASSPIKMGLVPDKALAPLDPSIDEFGLNARQKHLMRLCCSALTPDFVGSLPSDTTAVFLAGPEMLPQGPEGLGQNFLKALAVQTGLTIDPAVSRVFSLGRAAVFHAIDYALRFMESIGAEYALVGGVDTYRDHKLLAILDADDRVLAEGSTDGFSPGEAACFLLVSRKKSSVSGKNTQVCLYPPGLADEPGHMYSEEPYTGEGLSAAFAGALQVISEARINKIIASLNGENFWAKELGVATTRSHGALADNYAVVHPADCFGDLGAGFGAVALGMLVCQSAGSYLVYGSSDYAHRGAICATVSQSSGEKVQ